jgi:hypothetical protein
MRPALAAKATDPDYMAALCRDAATSASRCGSARNCLYKPREICILQLGCGLPIHRDYIDAPCSVQFNLH